MPHETWNLEFGAFPSAALDGNVRINQSHFMYRIIGADGREYGPISADQLRQWVGEGRANAASHVLPEGAAEWKSLGSLPEFSMLFGAPAQSPLPPTPFSAPAVLPSYTVSGSRTNGFATAGLILGILAVTLGWCCCYGLPFSVPGLVFSIIALGQINAHPEQQNGKAMAIIGIALCCLSFVIMLVLIVSGIAVTGWDSLSNHAHRL
jgi:hypothetical protein